MRYRISSALALLTALVLVAGATVTHAAPQLEGTWVLDRAQSELPKHHKRHAAPGQAAPDQKPQVSLTVEQDGDILRVTRTMARDGRARSAMETYTVDGTDRARPARGQGSVVTRAAWDGDRLNIVTSRTKATPRGEVQFTRASVWTLSPDGRTLTIETTMQGPRGERAMKAVFLKS